MLANARTVESPKFIAGWYGASAAAGLALVPGAAEGLSEFLLQGAIRLDGNPFPILRWTSTGLWNFATGRLGWLRLGGAAVGFGIRECKKHPDSCPVH